MAGVVGPLYWDFKNWRCSWPILLGSPLVAFIVAPFHVGCCPIPRGLLSYVFHLGCCPIPRGLLPHSTWAVTPFHVGCCPIPHSTWACTPFHLPFHMGCCPHSMWAGGVPHSFLEGGVGGLVACGQGPHLKNVMFVKSHTLNW